MAVNQQSAYEVHYPPPVYAQPSYVAPQQPRQLEATYDHIMRASKSTNQIDKCKDYMRFRVRMLHDLRTIKNDKLREAVAKKDSFVREIAMIDLQQTSILDDQRIKGVVDTSILYDLGMKRANSVKALYEAYKEIDLYLGGINEMTEETYEVDSAIEFMKSAAPGQTKIHAQLDKIRDEFIPKK